MQPILEQKQQL